MQDMAPEELAFAITAAVSQAARHREYAVLAGTQDEGPDPFAELIDVLERGREQAIEMRDHAHAWVLADDETDGMCCAICGADGNA